VSEQIQRDIFPPGATEAEAYRAEPISGGKVPSSGDWQCPNLRFAVYDGHSEPNASTLLLGFYAFDLLRQDGTNVFEGHVGGLATGTSRIHELVVYGAQRLVFWWGVLGVGGPSGQDLWRSRRASTSSSIGEVGSKFELGMGASLDHHQIAREVLVE
jgi:hypothetical protein